MVPSYIDKELLAVLDRAFAHHAGRDGVIDFADLKKALGLRSDYLAKRMLFRFTSGLSWRRLPSDTRPRP